MDFLFGGGGGGGQSSQLSFVAAATTTSHHHNYDLTAATSSAAPTLTSAIHFNGHDNGPILYDNLNRTSAIDDIRSVVIYIFISTIFLSFFLILPGIRNEKFPTFLCVTTSLLVSSIIIISLNGTTWHVGEAPVSAPYKAFSRDRIQGDLSVRMGLQSVNISLKAHKYYILHATNGPMMMVNVQSDQQENSNRTTPSAEQQPAANLASAESKQNLADELVADGSSDGPSHLAIDTELEVDEPFSSSGGERIPVLDSRRIVRSSASPDGFDRVKNETVKRTKRQEPIERDATRAPPRRYTIKRLHVDINYNERFYWIGPMQMRQEYQSALERGLPYPILTCIEYLSQDEAGFNWSRQYRAAGYYTTMLLWASASVCALMFCLHCAAPKYGIYAMQTLGLMLLATNVTYAILIPRGDRQLVIPFEGQSVTFRLGWNFWLVLVGGCLALLVGTTIVIIDKLFPDFIFTTVLDVNFDSSASRAYFQRKHKVTGRASAAGEPQDEEDEDGDKQQQQPQRAIESMPPFMRSSKILNSSRL